MEAGDAIAVARSALLLTLTVAGPLLVVALIVGFVIGLLQAVTQIQEPTLTFVPKLLAMGIVLVLAFPFIGAAMSGFMADIVSRIVVR